MAQHPLTELSLNAPAAMHMAPENTTIVALIVLMSGSVLEVVGALL